MTRTAKGLDDEFLSTTELAEYLGVPARTLEDWRANGTGPRFHRFGRHVRYSLADAAAFIRAARSA